MALREADTRPAKAKDYFQPRRFTHANLYIGELERSMDFYKNVVGLREAYRRPPIKAGFLNNGNTHHDIGMVDLSSSAARASRVGLNHLAWELETQVDLVDGYRRSSADGVQYDMTIDHEISHSVYFKDPDGNLNEIYADTGMRWHKERAGNVMKPTFLWTPGSTPPSDQIHYEPSPEFVRVEHAVFHPLKITGACVAVEKFAETHDFYIKNVGLKPLYGDRNSRLAVLTGTLGERSFTLVRAEPDRPAGLHHMNFVIGNEADLEASIKRAKKDGLKVVREIDRPNRRGIVVADPDGLKILFYVDRTPKFPDLRGIDEAEAIYLV